MRIDIHHHFWNYSQEEYGWIGEHMSILRRDFGPDDLRAVTAPAKIDKVISVQARQTIEETSWLLDLAERHDIIGGVVGWVPLASPELNEVLDKFADSQNLKAVRHVVQDEPDDEFILGKDFNRGIRQLKAHSLVYDILIYAKHLPATLKFVDQHPDQHFVLDHIAKPTIRAAEFDEEWKKHLLELGKRENVDCKFSGVATEVRDEEWDVEKIRPYWDVALEAFGTKRLMYGSDWPVCLLKTEYARWVKSVGELAKSLSADEQSDFWGNNAARAYSVQ